MDSRLPATGTAELLELLDPYVPDDFINQNWPRGGTGGRRRANSAAQLFRLHLLCLLSPVHSVNLLVKMLPEQRAWRKFARLRRQNEVPGVRMWHEFRERMGVGGLRRINQHLLQPLIQQYARMERSVGLIDATDLPAACVGFKKKHRPILGTTRRAGRSHAQNRPEPLLRGLQETYVAPMAAQLSSGSFVGSAGQLGGSRERVRGRAARAQSAPLPEAMGLVSAVDRGGHGLSGGRSQASMPPALACGHPHQAQKRHEIGVALCGLEPSRLSARGTSVVVGLR